MHQVQRAERRAKYVVWQTGAGGHTMGAGGCGLALPQDAAPALTRQRLPVIEDRARSDRKIRTPFLHHSDQARIRIKYYVLYFNLQLAAS
jgi:hypothetical protein